MSDHIGYAVIEWNQAGGPPELADTDLCTGMDEAKISLTWHEESTAKAGRKERYAIASVYIEEEPA